MRKVGILTLNGNFNYGNRLQNYALQEVIRDLGFDVETIVNTSDALVKSNVSSVAGNKIKKFFEGSTSDVVQRAIFQLWKRVHGRQIKDSETIRQHNFQSFSSDFIKETSFQISNPNIPADLHQQYDYFVTGSDQVWNPFFRKGSPIDFLTFAPIEKRIAYAPSFGIDVIPEEFREKYGLWLTELEKLSVREVAGAKIIKDLTDKTVPVLLDPTLLLTKEKWSEVAKTSAKKPKGKYLLTYFLGGIPKEHLSAIHNIARDNNLEIVNLGNVMDLDAYKAGPREFIDYIMTADLFCTDSFHGVIFSILFTTPFIVFKRRTHLPSMYSRMDTLLEKFQLESREYDSVLKNGNVLYTDFSRAVTILDIERDKSLSFLKNSMDKI